MCPSPRLVRLLWVLVCCLGLAWDWIRPTAARAQSHRLRFDRQSLAEGLSQASGQVILQDSRGFIWIGTEDGLNRYDGYRFEVLRHDPQDPDSLADNLIDGLYEDRRGKLWIFFERAGYLNSYDLASGRFRRYVHDPNDSRSLLPYRIDGPKGQDAQGVYEEADGKLWIATHGGGINQIDPVSGEVTRIVPDPEDAESLSHGYIDGLFEDRSKTLWITTRGGGLNRRLPPRGSVERFARYRHDPTDPSSLGHDDLNGILEDGNGVLWIGTWGGGLIRFDPERGRFERLLGEGVVARPALVDADGGIWVEADDGVVVYDWEGGVSHHYRHDPGNPTSISSGSARRWLQDRTGALWIATEGQGLMLYEREASGFLHFRQDPSDPHSVSSNAVRCLFEDRSGILWLGTYGGGVNRFSRYRHKFTRYRNTSGGTRDSPDDPVFALHEDRGGNLWVGGHTGGLQRYDARRERVVERYGRAPGSVRDLGSDYVRAIYEDRRDRLWVGTIDGLALIDREGGRVARRYIHVKGDPETLTGNFVATILEDRQGRLWIGGTDWHLFDPESGKFRRYGQNTDNTRTHTATLWSRDASEDRAGKIWISTFVGLFRFDPEDETFVGYTHDLADPTSLSHNFVMAVHEDGDGILWIATFGGGLNRFDRETGRFTHLSTANGLPSDSLYSILPDDDGRLWISSNQGLSRFDPKSGEFTNFDAGDGLQANEFNARSRFQNERGEMFFGGVAGFNIFHPSRIELSGYNPPVHLTAMRQLGRPVELARPLYETEQIGISYRENFFSFEFAALDYSEPNKNRYIYQLEGFNDGWIEAGQRRFASYTNLDGGTYIFRVRATNSDGVWGSEEASIRVVVTPPPWKRWWAYGVYGLTFAGCLFVYTRYRQEKDRRQQEETERLRAIDRLKDEFLANTSHELRTPLYGMMGLAESLADGARGEVSVAMRHDLAMIVASGRRLTHLINDILDLSKMRHESLVLTRSAVDLRALVDVVLSLSRGLVGTKGLELKNAVAADLSPADADESRLEQILHNLVGNAVKFTDEGYVEVSAMREKERLVVRVRDTGLGIPKEHQERIFRAFTQADASAERLYGGTGLGLAVTRRLVELHGGRLWLESKPGSGSTFFFSLGIADGETAAAPVRERPETSPPAVEPAAAAPSIEVAPEALVSHRGCRLLVVDDEPVNRQVLLNHLQGEGFELTAVASGPEALVRLAEASFDLVLLDVMMPKMSGYEVCRRIRETTSPQDMPVIFLTAKNQASDLVLGFSAGANDYLVKPIAKGELLARVRSHLDLLLVHRRMAVLVDERTREVREREQLISDLERFNYAVSHDLKNPLTTIRNFVGAVRHNVARGDAERAAADLTVVDEAANTMERLLDDLIRYSRLGPEIREPESVALDDVAQLAAERLAEPLAAGGFEVVVAPGLPKVNGDPALLLTLFLSLYENALCFIGETPHPRLEVKVRGIDGEAVVRVCDNGIGIEEAYLEKIFRLFERLDSERHGSGVGLALARRIVEAHGGRIWAESPGRNAGTTICFTLPE